MDADLSIVGWRVWYANGKVWSSAQNADWSELPKDDVQCVMLYYADGTKRIMQAAFYFRWDGPQGLVYGQNEDAPPDPARYPGVQTLIGKWTTDANFKAITDVAMASVWP